MRTVHKKTEITEDYTDNGWSWDKILFGMLIGIGIGAAIVYILTKKEKEKISSASTSFIQQEPKFIPNILIDNVGKEKWRIIRNETGGIEEIEILNNDVKKHDNNHVNDTSTVVLRPDNANIHKHV